MFDRTSLLGLAAVTLVALPSADLRRKAEAGETRERSFNSVVALTVVDMAMSIDGEELDPERIRGLDVTNTTTFSLTTKDVVSAAADGRATKFVRTYEALAQKSERSGGEQRGGPGGGGGGDRGPRELSSALAGEDVIFTWDADESEYVATLPENSTLDASLLDGLVADLEFAQFLPGKEVEVGEEWEVDLAAMGALMRPAGNLHFTAEEAADDRGARRGRMGGRMGGSPNPESLGVEADHSGSIKARLVEVIEVDGGRGARIEVEFDATAKYDMTSSMESVTRDTERGSFTMTTIEAVLQRKLKGKGELVWNTTSGHLISFTIDAELATSDTNATETVIDGADSVVTERETLSEGTLKFEYTIE